MGNRERSPIRGAIDNIHRNMMHPLLTRGNAENDREIAHERAISYMERIQHVPLALTIMDRLFSYDDPILETHFAGLTAPNPLGIAAGFDKNARVHHLLGRGLGFGSVTVGSITKVEYEGNPRPRIFDLPQSGALINRMGFPGEGVEAAKKRLDMTGKPDNYLLIVNFAASRPSFDTGEQIEHYNDAAQELVAYGHEGEANISSPNTEGVRGLQEPEVFTDIADAVTPIYLENCVPIRFKFGPDLDQHKLLRNARIIIDKKGAGITVTNTSTNNEVREILSTEDVYRNEVGGISGNPITQRSLEVSHNLYQTMGEELPIHRIGGIKDAQDVWDALTFGGATTVDVYTAFVRRETSTPNFARNILSDLASAMRLNGMESMEDFRQLRGKRVPYPLFDR